MGRTPITVALTAILALILWGCTPRSAVNRLDRADSLVVAAPDSALAILDSIDPSRLHSADYRARYALLMSYARYRTGHNDRSDSLISIATSHFTEPTRNAMLAHFTHGFILKNDSCYLEAVDHLLRSEKIALQLRDSFQLAMIYRDLASVYSQSQCGLEAVNNAVKSAKYMRSYHDSTYLWDAECILATYLNNQERYKESVEIAEPYVAKSLAQKDDVVLAKALHVCAYGYKQLHNYDRANKYFSLMFENHLNNEAYDLSNYVESLCSVGRIDKATDLLRREDGTLDTVQAPALYWMKLGKYNLAYSDLCRTIEITDSLLLTAQVQDLTYKEKCRLQENLRLKERTITHRNYTLLICVVVFILMGATVYARRKEMKARIAVSEADRVKTESEKEMLLTELNALSLKFQRNNESSPAQDLIKISIGQMEKILVAYQQTSEDESKREVLFKKLLANLNEMSKEGYYTCLVEYLSGKGVLSDLEALMPDISQIEKKVFVYTAVGFSPKVIAAILSTTPNAISIHKTHLRTKLRKIEDLKATKLLDLLR